MDINYFDFAIEASRKAGMKDLAAFLEKKKAAFYAAAGEGPVDDDDVSKAVNDALDEFKASLEKGIVDADDADDDDVVVDDDDDDDDDEDDDDFLKKATRVVKAFFSEHDWRYHDRLDKDGDRIFELGFTLPVAGKKMSIKVKVYLEKEPKCCRICATLPFSVDETYAYPFTMEMAKINYPKRYGAFTYDERDGEVDFDYCFPVLSGLRKEDFEKAFRAVISSASDDDDVPVLMKYAVGKFKKADRSVILSKINPLVDEMTDEE